MRSRLPLDKVISGGYCIGCGACAALPASPVRLSFESDGRYRATVLDAADGLENVCPFSESALDESEIAKSLFAPNGAALHRSIGYHLATYAGHVAEGTYRDAGSSGGMGTWIAAELLRLRLVDGVLHVAPSAGPLFEYKISRTIEDVRQGAKSRYYPSEMSSALREVIESPGRYAFVGIPCFVKAVRLSMRQVPVLDERIRFTISLVCGHLKSAQFGEMLAWQIGIYPKQLKTIDFRSKIPGSPASEYGIDAVSSDGERIVAPVKGLFGSNWGWNLFRYQACNYCDDVVGETADVSVGDAWLPEFVQDSRGTNVVVVRNPQILEILAAGITDRRLALAPIEPDRVARSQRGGFRDRRSDLAYRLALKDSAGEWRPPKRVRARRWHLGPRRKALIRLRMRMAALSHEAFGRAKASGSFSLFREELQGLLGEYSRLNRITFSRRIAEGLKRRFDRLTNVLMNVYRKVAP